MIAFFRAIGSVVMAKSEDAAMDTDSRKRLRVPLFIQFISNLKPKPLGEMYILVQLLSSLARGPRTNRFTKASFSDL
jgi:hypothetical protein